MTSKKMVGSNYCLNKSPFFLDVIPSIHQAYSEIKVSHIVEWCILFLHLMNGSESNLKEGCAQFDMCIFHTKLIDLDP